MKKTKCNLCGYEFANKGGNFNKHFKVCDGSYIPKNQKGKCIYCEQYFDLTNKKSGWMANHVRWCENNPKKQQYIESARHRFTIFTHTITLESRAKAAEKIKQAWEKGIYDNSVKNKRGKPGKKHSQKTKMLISEKARCSPHRRLKKNVIKYKDITLDSTWEYELAKRLDELNIKWIRPKPIKWKDKNNIEHHYFPDFYLEQYDLYLDPKNNFAYKVQEEKINILTQLMNNLIIIHSLDQCKNFDPLKYTCK